MGFSSSTFTSFIGCTPVDLDLGDEKNVVPLSGDVVFVRKHTDNQLSVDAGCEKRGNVVHVITDTSGKLQKVMCPSFGGNGECLLGGDRICPNQVLTSKLPGQD